MSGKEKPTLPPPNPKEKLGSGLRPEEEKPKEEIKDREGPLVDKELPPNEIVIKKVKPEEEKPKEKRVSPDDTSFHVNLTELKFTSVKEFFDKLTCIERMVEWLVVQRVTDAQKLVKQPNITDILKKIMSKMEPVKVPTETEEEKEDEVPPTT